MKEFDAIGRIIELCALRNWTYYRLSKESGIPYSTLNTMLRKTKAPSIPTLERICSGFGITLAQFFSSEDERARLTREQQQCLSLWDALSDTGKQLASVYMQAILDREQNT